MSSSALACSLVETRANDQRRFTNQFLRTRRTNLILLGNVSHQRVVGVGVRQKRADGEQDFAYGQGRTPLVLENVEANGAVGIDVAMVDARAEYDLGALKGILDGEGNVEEEDATSIRRLFRTHNGRYPLKDVVALWTSTAVAWGIDTDVGQLLLDPWGRG